MPSPFVILSHKITARCDCRCRFCDNWTRKPVRPELTHEQVLRMLGQAAQAGIRGYIAWGGEPLLAPRLPEWLAHASALGMETSGCTAGATLAERAAAIGPVMDLMAVSIEQVGEAHDRLRGVPGLFRQAVRGIEALRKHVRGRVVLWSNVSRDNQDAIEPIAALARDLGVSVDFFPAARVRRYNPSINLSPEERLRVFTKVKSLRFAGYPVGTHWHALDLMATGKPFKCSYATLTIHVEADGSIYACEPAFLPDAQPLCNVADVDLSSPEFLAMYERASTPLLTCNNCLLPCVANNADHQGDGLREHLRARPRGSVVLID